MNPHKKRYHCSFLSGSLALHQLAYARPAFGYSRHRTPLDGLYLCGAGAHPGVWKKKLSKKLIYLVGRSNGGSRKECSQYCNFRFDIKAKSHWSLLRLQEELWPSVNSLVGFWFIVRIKWDVDLQFWAERIKWRLVASGFLFLFSWLLASQKITHISFFSKDQIDSRRLK